MIYVPPQPSPAPLPTRHELKQERRRARERFRVARRVENQYGAQLRQVAHHIGEIVKGFAPSGSLEDFIQIRDMLQRYSDLLRPWARSVTSRMIAEVSRRDSKAWIKQGRIMGRALAREIETAPTGELMRGLMQEQVDLITSLPREATERVHKLTIEGISEGERADTVAAKILETGRVTKSRAMLIARTEVARTASTLTMARAQHVGSEGYLWRTAMDSDVRPRHQKLEGQYIRWDEPPIAGESGERAHAGQIYNCRCFPEPILPDVLI